MKVSVIGLGYIGLPTAALISSHNIQVHGVDVSDDVVKTINKGTIHIIEPGLEELVKSSVEKGFLKASTHVEKADVFLIAVPTPFKDNHEPDLSFVKSAVLKIAPILESGNLVILESTSPVGTSEIIMKWMKEMRPDLNFPEINDNISCDLFIAYCPERVLPGNIIYELTENNRIIGGLNLKSATKAQNFYNIFISGKCLITNAKTAELTKLVENSYRDVGIAFANELSLICDKLGINVWELIDLANHHPRVDILKPGPGVGGHCIAVDPWFIVHSAPEDAKIVKLAREVNDEKPDFVVSKVYQAINEISQDISKINITCFGLSFKPDIDDLRESPALYIARKVSSMGFKKNFIVEPNIKELPEMFGKSELVDLHTGINSSDILLMLVDHSQFKDIDREILSGKKVLDTRGIWID